MKILCRLGVHTPHRDKALIDLSHMKHKGHCKRCGAPMERSPGHPWRLQNADASDPPIDSATGEGGCGLGRMASERPARLRA